MEQKNDYLEKVFNGDDLIFFLQNLLKYATKKYSLYFDANKTSFYEANIIKIHDTLRR